MYIVSSSAPPLKSTHVTVLPGVWGLCGESYHRPGVATGTSWHWGGIGTIRTNVAALGGLQDWVPVSWDSGEDPPVISRLECQIIMG